MELSLDRHRNGANLLRQLFTSHRNLFAQTSPRRAPQELQDNFTDWYYKWVIREQALSVASCNIPWRLVCGLENDKDIDQELWGYNSDEDELWQDLGREFEGRDFPEFCKFGGEVRSWESSKKGVKSQLLGILDQKRNFEEVDSRSDSRTEVSGKEQFVESESPTDENNSGTRNCVTFTSTVLSDNSEGITSDHLIGSANKSSDQSGRVSRLNSLQRYSSVLSEEYYTSSCSSESDSDSESESDDSSSYTYSSTSHSSSSSSSYSSYSYSSSSDSEQPQPSTSPTVCQDEATENSPGSDHRTEHLSWTEPETPSSDYFNISDGRQSLTSSNISTDQLSLYNIECLVRRGSKNGPTFRDSLSLPHLKNLPSLTANCSVNNPASSNSGPSFRIKLPKIKRPRSRKENSDNSLSETVQVEPTFPVLEPVNLPDPARSGSFTRQETGRSGSFARQEPGRRPIKKRCRHNSYYDQNLKPLLDTSQTRTSSPGLFTREGGGRSRGVSSGEGRSKEGGSKEGGRRREGRSKETVEYVFVLNQGLVERGAGGGERVATEECEEDITLSNSIR